MVVSKDKEDGSRNGVGGKVMGLFLMLRKYKVSALKLARGFHLVGNASLEL